MKHLNEQKKYHKAMHEHKAVKMIKWARNAFILSCMVGILCVYASAAPAGVDTSFSTGLINIALWVVRIIMGFGGGLPAINAIVDGVNNENPSKRNHGIVGIVATGAGIAATFALPALFNF